MNNKQPFYHRAVILFTATRDIPSSELLPQMKETLERFRGVIPDTLEIEECDAEPGDPCDLVGIEGN